MEPDWTEYGMCVQCKSELRFGEVRLFGNENGKLGIEFKQYIFSAQRPRARLILSHFYPGHLTDQERMRYRNEVGRTDFERKK